MRSTDRLRSAPEAGSIVDEPEGSGLREICHGSYRIVYRIEAVKVRIIAVFHGSMLIERALGEDGANG
jgi:toxin ParE1/3/4